MLLLPLYSGPPSRFLDLLPDSVTPWESPDSVTFLKILLARAKTGSILLGGSLRARVVTRLDSKVRELVTGNHAKVRVIANRLFARA